MKLSDIEYAKATLLANTNLTCVLCKTIQPSQTAIECDTTNTPCQVDQAVGQQTIVYPSDKRGIAPLLGFVDDGVGLKGFSVADKIVGKAAALLFAFVGIVAVHACVLSVQGQKVLQDFGIECTFDKLVDSIQNRQNTGICPMEQTVACIEQPNEAVVALKNKVKQLMQGC